MNRSDLRFRSKFVALSCFVVEIKIQIHRRVCSALQKPDTRNLKLVISCCPACKAVFVLIEHEYNSHASLTSSLTFPNRACCVVPALCREPFRTFTATTNPLDDKHTALQAGAMPTSAARKLISDTPTSHPAVHIH
jgi:hypothetical protein